MPHEFALDIQSRDFHLIQIMKGFTELHPSAHGAVGDKFQSRPERLEIRGVDLEQEG